MARHHPVERSTKPQNTGKTQRTQQKHLPLAAIRPSFQTHSIRRSLDKSFGILLSACGSLQQLLLIPRCAAPEHGNARQAASSVTRPAGAGAHGRYYSTFHTKPRTSSHLEYAVSPTLYDLQRTLPSRVEKVPTSSTGNQSER